MADSNITKKALASALKDLMEIYPFSKISIGNICEKCDMNRKSFYYHFKDKYDLVCWIFDAEFSFIENNSSFADSWTDFEKVCKCFYENRKFYKKVFKIEGQNSLKNHLREKIRPLILQRLEEVLDKKNIPVFYGDIFTEFVIFSVERWLLSKECVPPEEFIKLVKELIENCAAYICYEMDK